MRVLAALRATRAHRAAGRRARVPKCIARSPHSLYTPYAPTPHNRSKLYKHRNFVLRSRGELRFIERVAWAAAAAAASGVPSRVRCPLYCDITPLARTASSLRTSHTNSCLLETHNYILGNLFCLLIQLVSIFSFWKWKSWPLRTFLHRPAFLSIVKVCS